jgi:hypothetical protein
MAIKEPVFGYKKYRVSPNVEYIPCLPVQDNVHPTATRIPKGAELTFLNKYDNELVKIQFKKESVSDANEYVVLAMRDFVCDNVLPIYMRNG